MFNGLIPSSSSNAIDPRTLQSTGAYTIGMASQPTSCSNCLPGPMNSDGRIMWTPAVELYMFTNVTLPSGNCDLSNNYFRISSYTPFTASCTSLTSCTLGSTVQDTPPTRFVAFHLASYCDVQTDATSTARHVLLGHTVPMNTHHYDCGFLSLHTRI